MEKFKIHEKKHERNFTCDVCEQKFLSKSSLVCHISARHLNKEHQQCKVCHKSLKSLATLKSHMKIHTDNKRLEFKCDICHKVYMKKVTFESHQRYHTGEKPFLCIKCGLTFHSMNSLQCHEIKFHEKKKRKTCDICNKSFYDSYTLNRHKKTHVNEKPFICDVCNKGFKRKDLLAAHLKIHTGEKSYKCETCEITFVSNKALSYHDSQNHRSNIPKRFGIL